MSDLHPVPHRYASVAEEAFAPSENGAGSYVHLEPETNAFKEYWGVFRRHWLIVLGIVGICTAAAAYKALNDPPQFRSSAVIRLTQRSKMMAGGLGSAAMSNPAMGDPIISQIEILRSRSVTSMVVDALGLRLVPDNPTFPGNLLKEVEIAPGVVIDSLKVTFQPTGYILASRNGQAEAAYGQRAEVDGVTLAMMGPWQGVPEVSFQLMDRARAAAGLQQGLLAERRDRTDLIDVGYTANDPEMAQLVVNAIVDEFQAFNAGTAQEEARRRRIFIEGQLAHTDSLLQAAQAELTAFRSNQRMFSSREGYAARQANLQVLRNEREQLSADRQVLQSLIARLQAGTPAERVAELERILAISNVSGSAAVSPLYQQLLSNQAVMDTLVNSGRSRSHPDIQRVESLIANTRTDLIRALGNYLYGTQQRVTVLDNLIRTTEADMESLPATEAAEVDVMAKVEYLTTVSGQLRTEYQQAQIDEAVQAGEVELVDPALPGTPIAAGRIRTVLFGLVLGLMLGGGAAIGIENTNTSIRRKDEVMRVLRIPELAVIPRFVPEDRTRRLLSARLSKNGKHGPTGSAGELIAAKDPHSTAAEAYRTLRTNLIFSQSLHALRTLVVTSSAPSEGKSTTAANLAATFAQQGRRVVLVDCDLRKARLHKMFGVPREPGFTHLLLGLKTSAEVVRETNVPGLHFLAAGTLPPNPAELVGGEQMHATLELLSKEFDLVILDTPPLLAASDAALMGRLVDGVVLVVRAGQTERDAAKQAVRSLTIGRARILGAVLNDPDSKVGKYGGHYQYEYYGERA